jgi:hypothetical protein
MTTMSTLTHATKFNATHHNTIADADRHKRQDQTVGSVLYGVMISLPVPLPALFLVAGYLHDKDFASLSEAGVEAQAVFGSGSSAPVQQKRLEEELRALGHAQQEATHARAALWARMDEEQKLHARQTEQLHRRGVLPRAAQEFWALLDRHLQRLDEYRAQDGVLQARLHHLQTRGELVKRELHDRRGTRTYVRRAQPFGVLFRRDRVIAVLKHIFDGPDCVPSALVSLPRMGNMMRNQGRPAWIAQVPGALSPDVGYVGDTVRAWWPDLLPPPVSLKQLRKDVSLFRGLRQQFTDNITFFQPFIDSTMAALTGPAPVFDNLEGYVDVVVFLMLVLPRVRASVSEVIDHLVQFVTLHAPARYSSVLAHMIPDLMKEAAQKDARSAWVLTATAHGRRVIAAAGDVGLPAFVSEDWE